MAERRSSTGAARRTASGAAKAPASVLTVRENEDPWSESELDGVRAELTAEVTRLAAELVTLQESIDGALRDSGDGAGDDAADTGTKAFERDQEATLLANARDSMEQTQRALARITDGTYGDCESCGRPIGKMRLQAFSRATLCVTCKQRQERR